MLQQNLLSYIKNHQPTPAVWGFTRQPSWESARALMEIGARDLVTTEELLRRLQPQIADSSAKLISFPRPEASQPSKLHIHQIPYPINGLDGPSQAVEQLRQIIRKTAPLETTLLISGPTGSGKELLARTIHGLSARARGPFIVVPCGAIADPLFEAELFGVEKGAFTGADRDKVGLLQRAHGGTLLLDGVSQLSLAQQTKLLRVLQDRSATPVGSSQSYSFDARVISTSGEDLERAVEQQRFREDLMHRLRVIEIQVPSLRERRSDIPDLAQLALARLARTHRRPPLSLEESVMEKLLLYPWPGNVRELENAMEHGASLAWGNQRSKIEVGDLPEKIQWASMGDQHAWHLKEATRRFERDYIHQTLKRSGGNKEETAELLGLSLATLYRKLAS
jgi:two-component system response regulator HydG